MDLPIVIPKSYVDGIGNTMNGLISGLSIDPRTTIDCNQKYSLGLYNTVLDSKHIYKGGSCSMWSTFRLLVLKSEEAEQEHTPSEFADIQTHGRSEFSNTCAIDMNYNPNRICDRVKNRILGSIHSIVFQPHIHTWVKSFTDQIIPSTTLGISVRTWKAKHETNIHRAYNSDTYKHAILDLIPGMTHVLLSVDNDSVLDEYMSFLSQFPVSVVVLRQSQDMNDTQYAFVKMLALSKCSKFIGSRMSTFSELVFWFSDCKTLVTPLF